MTEYLLKLSLGLALVWLFYCVILRPLTFYQWNRFFLAGFSLAFFLLPFINVGPWMPAENAQSATIIQAIPRVNVSIPEGHKGGALSLKIPEILLIVFVLGVLIRLVQLALQWRSLQNIKTRAVMASMDGVRLYDVDGNISPFSFSNSVFINSRLHTHDELEKIIQHEFVHVKQKHTTDLLIAEFICIINWFNPFAWLIRRAIRQNLEFIADHTVIQTGLDARQYQYLLLKVVGIPQYSLSNNFNFSSLKKRIAMINKNRSSRVNLIKFVLILPLLMLLLLAFRQKNPLTAEPAIAPVAKPAPVAKALPQPASHPQKAKVSRRQAKNIVAVSPVKVAANSQMHVEAPDSVPVTIPALPPLEPLEPIEPLEPVAPPEPKININGNENIDIPAAPSKGVKPPAGLSKIAPVAPVLPTGVKSIHQKDNVVTIYLKNGKKEIFHLDKPEEKAAFEKKYGAMPAPPAPPLKPAKSYTTKDPFILSLLEEKKDNC